MLVNLETCLSLRQSSSLNFADTYPGTHSLRKTTSPYSWIEPAKFLARLRRTLQSWKWTSRSSGMFGSNSTSTHDHRRSYNKLRARLQFVWIYPIWAERIPDSRHRVARIYCTHFIILHLPRRKASVICFLFRHRAHTHWAD